MWRRKRSVLWRPTARLRCSRRSLTFGLTDKANFAREEGASDQLMASGWYFTTLDDATEATLSAIVRKAAS